MRYLRFVLLFSLLPIVGRAESDSGLLRFDSEGFTINAEGFNVKRSDLPSAAGQTPVVVLFLSPTGGFAPNVNVLIQDFPNSISDYVSLTKKEFDSAGIDIVKEQTVSPEEWMVEYSGTLSGKSLHWYARALKKGAKVYLTTATATPDQWGSVSEKLIQCVDSFGFIGSAEPQPAS
jgi:hypothetical protein